MRNNLAAKRFERLHSNRSTISQSDSITFCGVRMIIFEINGRTDRTKRRRCQLNAPTVCDRPTYNSLSAVGVAQGRRGGNLLRTHLHNYCIVYVIFSTTTKQCDRLIKT